MDDTGVRHKARNGFCTQIGNAHFAWFGSTGAKTRGNFLSLLRAGYADFIINDEAIAYMRQRHLAGPVIARLADHPDRNFADQDAWTAHLEKLGITRPGSGRDRHRRCDLGEYQVPRPAGKNRYHQ